MADVGIAQDDHLGGNSISFSKAMAAWSHDLVVHVIVGFTVALFALSLRVYCRTRIIKSFGLDDITMCVAMVFFTAFMAVLLKLAHWAVTATHTIPYRTWDEYYSSPGAEDHRYGHRLYEASFLTFLVSAALIRISIGLLFLRVSRQVRGYHRWVCHTFIWLTGLSSVVIFFLILFECSPFGTSIETDDPRLIHCLPSAVMPIALGVYGIFAIIVDSGFALLPVWMLWGVQINKKSKIWSGILMSLGLIASSAVIWRLVVMAGTGFKHLEKLSVESGYELKIKVMISCIFEGSLGILASSMATLLPLFKKMRDFCRSYLRMASPSGPAGTSDAVNHPGPLTSNPPDVFMRREPEWRGREPERREREPEWRRRESPYHQLQELNRAATSFPGSPTSFRRILDPEPPHSPTTPRSMSTLSEYDDYSPALPTIYSGEVLPTSDTVSTMMSIPMSEFGSLDIPGTLTETASKPNISSPTTATIRSMD